MPRFVFKSCMVCSWFIVHQQLTTFNWSYRRLVAFVNFYCKNCTILHTIAILVYIRPFWHWNLMFGSLSCLSMSNILCLVVKSVNKSRTSTSVHRACCSLYRYQPKNLTLSPWILSPVCPNAMARMHWWYVATSLVNFPAWFQLGWGRIVSTVCLCHRISVVVSSWY